MENVVIDNLQHKIYRMQRAYIHQHVYPESDHSGSDMDQDGPDLQEEPFEGSSGTDSD